MAGNARSLPRLAMSGARPCMSTDAICSRPNGAHTWKRDITAERKCSSNAPQQVRGAASLRRC